MSELLTRTVLDILGSEPAPVAQEQAGWSPDQWTRLVAAGLDGIGYPEELGGPGGTLYEALTAVRAAAAAAAPVPLAETVLGAIPALTLVGASRPAGLTVPATFAATADVATEPAADGPRLRGVARRVPFARHADHLLVVIPAEAGQWRLALCAAATVRVTPHGNVAGEPRDDVDFTGSVPAALWELSDPARLRLSQLAAVARAAQLAAAGAQVLALTTHYAQERTQFGRPIAKFQAVAHNIALLAGEAAVAAAAVDAAAAALDGPDAGLAVMAAKARVSRGAGEVSRIAHQVFGALGFTQEHPLHRLTRRLLAWRDECGSDAACEREVGALVLAGGADGFWPLLTAASARIQT
jgi:acyl-CoA dehydrogenase